MAGQVGQMLMALADTVMIGRVGVVPLAASTFANTLLMVPFMFGIGLLACVSIRVSQGRGGKRHEDVKNVLRHGTWLSLAYGICTMLLILALLPFLDRFGQAPEVVAEAPAYLILCAISMVPVMVSIGWKNFGNALNQPWPPFYIQLSGVLCNIGLNWLLIYGHWGFPELGLAGAGWATLISRCLVMLALLLWLKRARSVKEWCPHHWWIRLSGGELKKLLALGVPVAFQMVCEVGAFAAASLMAGRIGVEALAAHQVALTCASTSFMIPLGVAMAITVRMGEAFGEGRDPKKLHRILTGGWFYGVVFTGASMMVFILCGHWLAGKIVLEPEVIDLAAKLLVIAGLFQLGDGLQVISSSALRGMGDVKLPAWLGVFSYWLVAVPLGAWLAFGRDLGAQGIWWGLAGGLSTAGGLLCVRAWRLASAGPAADAQSA